ncbi:3-phosphoshikimate 1-carboxyvinyltransferase [Anaeromicropila populeti]|uniref:3-phosphoshikimate 1-carboxyvinyltransferase n=1 Tax=Anaeromicropila populeti TaxID=37658 RepID=A0A1I6KW15_9FIRM|nr:3-phosphoshikimate 1-carboxyvinyltransferase [Anaeromicropila populeti]SFR95364.1 3-phosphoshikimate 1-carboxyvinyltransferase [Anaeromicropila populeti]
MKFHKANRLAGELSIPGDKSISHRGIMLGALADGTTEITNFLQGADCLSTIDCFRKMGVTIKNDGTSVLVKGNGIRGLKKSDGILDVGNSGTTTRLMSGILAAQNFETILNGDESIQRRPMRRIITPLSQMGANITSVLGNDCAPLRIIGGPLKGIHYSSPVASAQVKSSILFAGLYADGKTSVTEPYVSRNHTELMLEYFGASVSSDNTTASVFPCSRLDGQKVIVPGDISSATYFICAALIVPNSQLVIKNVGINPTRDGILQVCQQMGANIKLENVSTTKGEPSADLVVTSGTLHGTIIGGSLIPTLIDELPMIAVLAAYADGETIIKDAEELKVKESNRIDVMVENLKKMGADAEATDDGMIIRGGKALHGAVIDSKLDHRIAMTFAVAGLIADGTTEILGSECVAISYPDFYESLNKIIE